MANAAVVAIIVIAVFLLLLYLFCKSQLYVVWQSKAIVVERWGRFNRILTPGINFLVPFIDTPRRFTWRKTYVDVGGKIADKTTTNIYVDLRESVYSFVRQDLYTRDTVLVEVKALMYYSISDVRKAVYEVDDLDSAIQNTAQSQLKEVFGSMTFKEVLVSQAKVNQHMKKNFSFSFEKWGINVERIELFSITPKRTSDTTQFMKKQMIAERMRRADFITAEGNKTAMRLSSEGTKLVKVNMGVAEQEATRKRSEGDAEARLTLARAEKAALDTVAAVLESDRCLQSDYLISLRYLDFIGKLSNGGVSTDPVTLYLPYDVSSMSGVVSGLDKVFGRNRDPDAVVVPQQSASGTSRTAAARAGDTFAELN